LGLFYGCNPLLLLDMLPRKCLSLRAGLEGFEDSVNGGFGKHR
jgi:hypothetical protein